MTTHAELVERFHELQKLIERLQREWFALEEQFKDNKKEKR
jgi:hypothetical protein